MVGRKSRKLVAEGKGEEKQAEVRYMTRSQKNKASAPKREAPKRNVVQATRRTQRRGLPRSIGRNESIASGTPKETHRGRARNRRVSRRSPSMPRLYRMPSIPRLTPQRPIMSCPPNQWMINTPTLPQGPSLAPQSSWSYIPVELINTVNGNETSTRNLEVRVNVLEQGMKGLISNQNSRPRCGQHEDVARQLLDLRNEFRHYKTLAETEINNLADRVTECTWTYHRFGPCKMETEGPWQS